ncbi:hypothetical protein FisN_6Lh210 [Fistulifera solaris]|uniref:Uncharacterized protein n=1 Tax=Fistulifera solaris TaxID=1519565 RepID=A0A1Z5J659_FISSO|nr:hypothetical protein FisN_6Lh210 [Fistulifera solaris]|eukprot:GAX09416.1 hypothetical protein FisN_6Lh210 [Fistulifera solaris]
MRPSYQEHGYSGAMMHPERRYNNGDPYHRPPQGYSGPSTIPYDAHPQYDPAYHSAYHQGPPPAAYGPPPPHYFPRVNEPPRRSMYPEEPPYRYPDDRGYFSRPPAHYGPPYEQHPRDPYRRDYAEPLDAYGRPAYPDARRTMDPRGPPVHPPVPGPMGYPPAGYAPPIHPDRVPVSLKSINAGNHRGYDKMSWGHQPPTMGYEKDKGQPCWQRPSTMNDMADRMDGKFRERGPSEVPASDDDDEDASSGEKPEQTYDDFEDDDTIATQDATASGIDFLNLDSSKRFGVNLDFSQLEIVGEDDDEPESTPITRNPMDPRCWVIRPSANSILKGTRFARNAPIEHRVTFWQCDVTKIGEAEYMYGVRPEVIWWTKAELNQRLMEDDKDRLTNPVAKIYDHECKKAFEKLTERVKKALDRNWHPKPNIDALWNDAKLAKLIKPPIMTGLSMGFRGIELGGMAGRRLRARGHFEMIQEYRDESNYRTKRRARTARRGDAMGLASEEYTLIVRLWARATAMADQANAHVVNVLDARVQRARKQAAREHLEI